MNENEQWHKRFRAFKKEMGYTNGDISEITGLLETSVGVMTQPSAEFPRWLKLTLTVWERMSERLEKSEGSDTSEGSEQTNWNPDAWEDTGRIRWKEDHMGKRVLQRKVISARGRERWDEIPVFSEV